MSLFKTTAKDYTECIHGVRSQVRSETFNRYTPAVLGLGDLTAPSKEMDAVCAVFDLQGFTVFCSQVDPQLVMPEFLSIFLEWLFDSIKKHWLVRKYEDPTPGYTPLYTRLPYLAKFMGDGVLFLWDVADTPDHTVANIPGLIMDVLVDYRSEFLPKARATVANAPPMLRCGIARGKVFSVGNGSDFVGPCINIASRLQKLGGLNFAVSRRGFDADRHMSPAVRNFLLLKKVNIRGIGDDELVWIDREEFEVLSESDKAIFRDP